MSRAEFEGVSAAEATILSAVRDEWVGIALATGPADRPAAEHGVRLAYERAGLAPPRTVVWLDSPLEASYAVAMVRLLDRPDLVLDRDGVRGTETRPVRYAGDPVWTQVWDRVDPRALGEVGGRVGHRVWFEPLHRIHEICWRIRSDLTRRLSVDVYYDVFTRGWTHVGQPVGHGVADRLGPKVWGDVWPELREQFGGHVLLVDLLKDYGLEEFFLRVPPELSRLSWHHEWEEPFQAGVPQYIVRQLPLYDGLMRFGVDVGEPLDGLVQVARSAGSWYPFAHAVILTERPTALHLDADGRLHHPTGPAVVYPDGFAVHARHGTAL